MKPAHLSPILSSIAKSVCARRTNINLFLFSIIATLLAPNAWALNESPQTFTLDGKLYQAGTTTPLQDAAAKINIQIIDPTGKCVLYEEDQYVNTVSSEGYFHINVGSATGATKRGTNDPGRTMAQIFQNTTAITANNVSGQTCTGGAYTPSAGAVRYFRVTVTPSTTSTPDILTPDIAIDSVPSAVVAQSLQGLERASILQTNTTGSTVLTQANLEAVFTTPAYTNLQSILAGNFLKTDSSGASLPSYAANPAGASNGDIWFDSTTGEIKYQNGSGVQTVGSGSSGISSLTVGSSMSVNGSVAGTISGGTGTIDLTNTGVSAGTYSKVTVDAKGRVTAGAVSISEADIPSLTVAGKVSGNTITSGTISGSAAIDTTGNLISTGTVSGQTVQATNLRIYNGSNYIQMTAPVLSGNVNLTLPVDDGNSGEVLSTNGSGVLSWVASLTNSLASGKIFVGNGSNVATAVTVSGDGTLSNTGVLTIDTGTTAGKLVRIETPGRLPAIDGSALTNLTAANISGTIPVSKGGTASSSFGNSRIIASNGTGTALIDFTCSLNQVISFDSLGSPTCANANSLGSFIMNGGNSFASDISIGTNDNKTLSLKVNDTTAMTISQSGNIGIGTTNPIFKLDTRSNGINVATSIGAGAGGYGNFITGSSRGTISAPTATQLGDSLGLFGGVGYGATGFSASSRFYIEGRAAENWTDVTQGTSLYFGTTPVGNPSPVDRMVIDSTGNVGIGTTTPPVVAMDVQGQIRSRTADVTGATTVDWNSGNIQYTTDSCQAYTFNNLVDGASYTFVVKGATSAQCTFTSGALNFHFTPANTATNASSHTVYTFFRAGGDVYVSWTTGL